ncbi:hypothetical protein SK128_012107 [Halocaridina rubra]|uniref:Ig-like domain-containing protein n=1 Tax=Halocaridina rubra TaxID=373956 RepID=A0AAN8WQX1_HALRR
MDVKITGADIPLSADESSLIICESTGSRPPATLTWWIDDAQVIEAARQIVQDGNTSRSSLQLQPREHHDGAVLSCRAENSLLRATAIEDSKKLRVFCEFCTLVRFLAMLRWICILPQLLVYAYAAASMSSKGDFHV